MPRKPLSILLLVVFGLSSFTFKTHYCYHFDGSRFHGDCGANIRETLKHEGSSRPRLHERHYICFDIQFDKQYKQPDYTFKNFQDHYFILPAIEVLPFPVALPARQVIPAFSCRGGPPLPTGTLRGPPSI